MVTSFSVVFVKTVTGSFPASLMYHPNEKRLQFPKTCRRIYPISFHTGRCTLINWDKKYLRYVCTTRFVTSIVITFFGVLKIFYCSIISLGCIVISVFISDCCDREPGFNFQHLYSGSPLSVSPGLKDLTPSSNLCRQHIHTWFTHKHKPHMHMHMHTPMHIYTIHPYGRKHSCA